MAAQRHRREPEFEGGSQPVPDYPPDEPGRGRGPVFVIVAILGILSLAMPVAWGLGAIATVGKAAGTTGLVALWITWGLILIGFLWALWAMWRRAA